MLRALHIALTAEEATWVRATANGKVVFSGVMQANETKALSAADTVTLRLGNAGRRGDQPERQGDPRRGPQRPSADRTAFARWGGPGGASTQTAAGPAR